MSNKYNSPNNFYKLNGTLYTVDSFWDCYSHQLGNTVNEEIVLSFIDPKLRIISYLNYIKTNKIQTSKIGFAVIDDDYYKWMKENKLDNTPENRNLYATTISDDNMKKLWDLHELGNYMNVFVIPINDITTDSRSVTAASTNLSDKFTKILTKDISNSINICVDDIYIAPQTFGYKYIIENIDKINKYLKDKLYNKDHCSTLTNLSKLTTTEKGSLVVLNKFIIVAVKNYMDCIVDLKNLNKGPNKSAYELTYSQETESLLKHDCKSETIILNEVAISISDIDNYMKDLNDSISTLAKNKHIQVNQLKL